jgi:endonuclease/exonuclease/phosphatase family metal-dependent hydrolase
MELKIMSFNLRYQNEWDGINQFLKRYPRVIEVIDKESPDLVGFQEVTGCMKEILRENLKDYTLIGCGRDSNYRGESMLIGIKTKAFELISVENEWFSKTPSIPGSRYEDSDQSGCPRMFTSVLVKHHQIDTPIRFINTHLDHEGKNARMLESRQLIKYLSNLDVPFALTGDFNAIPDSEEIKYILSYGINDCTANLGPTFHAFFSRPIEKRIKIDYIFTKNICNNAYAIEDIPVDGQCYSDHNAVCALIEF